MLCKRCNNELPENSRFCMACGALQPMICPACQSESRPGSRTCSGCGKKLPVTYSGVTFYKRKKTPSQIAAMVLLVVGALLVLTAAVMFLMGTISDVTQPHTEEQVTETMETVEKEEFTVVVEEPITKPIKDPETVKKPVEETEVTEETEEEPSEETEEEPAEDVTEDPAEETEKEPEEETQAEPEEEPEAEPEEETPTEETKPSAAETEWFFPDSAERLLTDADVAGLTKAELQLARNEIYARHGRRFNNPNLQAWFDSCSWYNGTVNPADFDESRLSDTELANVYFLKEKENG